jgi:hypothetical protein
MCRLGVVRNLIAKVVNTNPYTKRPYLGMYSSCAVENVY